MIGIEANQKGECAIAVLVERAPPKQPVKLLHPINPGWQLGLAEKHGRADWAVVFAHRAPHPDCDFTIQAIETDNLPEKVRQAAEQIAANVVLPSSADAILSSVRAGLLRHNLAGAMLSSLSCTDPTRSENALVS